jgi:N-acetylglutamate synthase-like GNAT family acetyltransferase
MTTEYRMTTKIELMDFELIHQFLSNSYWATGIPKQTLQKAIENSLCFAVLEGTQLVGFARLITDKATYAYLADVFIVESHRGKGLSKKLMDEIIVHPDLQGLRRMVLATRDAHGLYEKYGFTELANPQTFMELWAPDVYQHKTL